MQRAPGIRARTAAERLRTATSLGLVPLLVMAAALGAGDLLLHEHGEDALHLHVLAHSDSGHNEHDLAGAARADPTQEHAHGDADERRDEHAGETEELRLHLAAPLLAAPRSAPSPRIPALVRLGVLQLRDSSCARSGSAPRSGPDERPPPNRHGPGVAGLLTTSHAILI